MLRALGVARMARARKVSQAVLAHPRGDACPKPLASLTWASWLYPVESIRVEPRLRRACAHGGVVCREMRRFPNRRESNPVGAGPSMGEVVRGAHHLVRVGIQTALLPRPCALQTVEARRARRALHGAVLQVFPTELTLIMSELRKLSTGCSQSQKTRGKPVNNGERTIFHSSRGKVLSCCSNLSSTKRLNP